MPQILLLGSGFVAGPCLAYLLKRKENHITIGCRHIEAAKKLSGGHAQTTPIALDVADAKKLDEYLAKMDLVISLIPYTHHAKVIESAIKFKKHVVTTSYISPAMAALDEPAKQAGITVFNEIGVDPGIDHLYAVKTIDEVHKKGGKIIKFLSYCGGLPAPEASNNPLGYKFSWSSRGVLLALRNNAKILEDGKIVDIPGPALMDSAKTISIYPAFAFEGYPNRDSTPYSERYAIPEAVTVIRGTLRYAGFPVFVKALVKMGLFDDAPVAALDESAATDVMWKTALCTLLKVSPSLSAEALDAHITTLITAAPSTITHTQATHIIKGLKWLGLVSESTPVTRRGNYLDCLCAALEAKMMYKDGERDMVMLQHTFYIEWADGKKETRTSTGLWFGEPHSATAMATTVGVPCAIATQLILDGKITAKGVVAPMSMDVVVPLITALEEEGISMVEEIIS